MILSSILKNLEVIDGNSTGCSTKKRIAGDACTYNTNDTNKSISDTAIKVASLQAGAFFNMDALQRSIQRKKKQ